VATLLTSGGVLLAGGNGDGQIYATAEIYNPATQGFVGTLGSMAQPRVKPTATLLPSGRVLIAGGAQDFGTSPTLESYDAASGTFGISGTMSTGRDSPTATLFEDGSVLLAGGDVYDENGSWVCLSSAELCHF
jgi:hypothetical protein